MSRRRWLGPGTILVAVIAIGWCASGRARRSRTMPPPGASPGVDAPVGHGGEPRPRRRSPAPPRRPDLPPPSPGRMATMMVDLVCRYSPSRCAEGRRLAAACGDGDTAACGAIQDLWLAPPIQPWFAKVVAAWACGLGVVRGCEYEDRYRGFQQWPDGRADDPAPTAACAEGDPAACYVLAIASYDHGAVDVTAARRGCDLGVADLCGMLAASEATPSAAVADLRRACDAGSPRHCGFLIDAYDLQSGCCAAFGPKVHGCILCPPADATEAARWSDRYTALTGKAYEPDDEPASDDP